MRFAYVAFFFIVSPLCLVVAQTTPAATHVQAAKEVLDLMQAEKMINATLEGELKFQLENNQQLAPFEAIMRQFFIKYAGWDSVKDDIFVLYTGAFSEAELKEISTFYRTKTGQKALDVFPDLMHKSMELRTEKIREHIEEFQEMVKNRQKELDKDEGQQGKEQPDKEHR